MELSDAPVFGKTTGTSCFKRRLPVEDLRVVVSWIDTLDDSISSSCSVAFGSCSVGSIDVDVHGSVVVVVEGGSSFVAGSGSSQEGLIVSVGASHGLVDAFQESFGLSHESLAGASHSFCAAAAVVVVVVSCCCDGSGSGLGCFLYMR